MLYMAAALPPGEKLRYGYADDIGIYATAGSPENCVQKAADVVHSILRWGRENRVAFDPAKCELMHFSRSRNPKTPPVRTPDGFTIKQTTKPALHWLGIWFDRKLKFTYYVDKRIV